MRCGFCADTVSRRTNNNKRTNKCRKEECAINLLILSNRKGILVVVNVSASGFRNENPKWKQAIESEKYNIYSKCEARWGLWFVQIRKQMSFHWSFFSILVILVVGKRRSFVIWKGTLVEIGEQSTNDRTNTHRHTEASNWEQGKENTSIELRWKKKMIDNHLEISSFLRELRSVAPESRDSSVDARFVFSFFLHYTISYRLQINYLCYKRQSNQLRKSAHETICQTRSTTRLRLHFNNIYI